MTMKTIPVKDQQVTIHRYHTLIVGAGAAGMNCRGASLRIYVA